MSYRSSYTPWKSSLSPNYKTGASSAYSSRDDVSATSRYSSLASPSSYRPSFSGGTYRLKRDTPIVPTSTYVSRYSAATSSPATKPDTSSTSDSSGSKPGQLKRYGSSASSLGKYSREPSPAALEHTNRIKSRDPSPATRSLRGKSRDPSPALDTKCKIGYGSSASSYRMNVPKSTTGNTYGTRYGSSSTAGRTPAANNSSTSISYLSASDFKARSISKAREAATRKSNEKELEAQKTEEKEENKPEATSNEESTGSSETDEEDDEEEEDNEEKFVSVAVCTRATSPTPPGTAPTVHRTRRIEIAKTIEKTIQRSTRKKKMLEKEIQSDRLDDSTRYSRFGLSSRVSSPYSPHTERYTSSSLRYSHSPLSTTASKSSSLNSTSESKKDDVSASSTSASSKANKSPLNSKSKLSPPKSIKITSRQSSMENLSAHKPPAAPKGESPTKSISSSTGVSTKLPNKDFRKSALNVGPTDRPRKSRTPSTGTDSDLNTVEALNGALQAIQRLERSPSAGSEVSNASNRSIRRTGTDSKLRPRCHNKSFVNGSVVSPKSPLSRNNSTSNIKAKSSTSTSSTTTQSSAGTTTTTSSSSGTESCTESKKSTKKIIKKKAIKDVTNTSSSTSTTATTTSPTTHSTADSRSIKSSSENSFSQQPPAASVNNQKAKKSDSSATNSRTTPKTPSDKDPLRRLKKLSSVSNFFAAQQQDNANNDEQIYLESSENSSSGNDLDRSLSKKSISLTQANETKTTPSPAVKTKTSGSSSKSNPNYTINSIDEPKNSIKTTKSTSSTSSTKTKTKTKSKSNTKSSSTSTSYCPQETTTVNESSIMPSELQTESLSPYTTTNPTTSSTSGTDQEESSWWQDTSRQIDTASALDFNLKDEMRFKIRHIDSGETAWWLRNDEDDTLADDDLKTLNQEEELEEDEDDEEEATDHIQSLTSTPSGNAAKLNDKPGGWWITNETNDETPNEDEEKHETIYVKSRSSNDLDYPSNGYCVEEAPVEAKPFPKSRITPETDWWNDDNEEAQAEYTVNNNPSLNSDKTSNKSGNNLSQLSDKLPKQNGSIQLKICRVESGEKPWWLQEEQQTETQPQENEITVEATIALPKKNKDKTDSSSSNSDSKNRWMSGPTKKVFNIPRVESGEKAWWQEETSESKSDKASENKNYKRNNSQEQEWWLEESSQQQKPPTTPQHNYQQNGYFEPPAPIQQQQQQYYHNTEEEAELQQYQHSSYNHNNLIDSQAELSNSFNFEYSERPPPLGQCASPVQQEELLPPPPPQQRQQCTSPYDNIPMTKVQTAASQQPILETSTNYMASGGGGGPIYQQDIVYLNQSPLQQQPQQQYFPHQRQQQQHQQNPNYLQQPPTPYNQYNNNELRSRNGQLFISRHQNIDELLGGSCRPISPLYYDNNSFQTMPPQLQPQQTPTPSQQRNMFVEEITPDQVRIHDSTAQMPIIQRMERDDWQRDSLAAKPTTPPRFEQRMIDDAAIQVYKDGDYGSYLDLESSLAEQSEEIEGLNSSRKNSLVVRTQLSVRVHAIIEKLLSAEGSDLRRALFSLKQVFQEDKDLVHAFVALGGLNCLVRVGNGADQNYQNYILRALGQVMLYVDGMNGVMKHEPTMQWLYSLIASNYRSVVKTALKLLLVFVEYAESNCHVLVSAIHAVDKQQGTLPWSNIMRLLKDYDNADAELVIYAASLINKTLEGLNDQDSFYDESDLLEQQGMESVIQHYMSKPGTDMDLLNQLQLYEAVLKFEDGESDGTRLPDNTLRKTQRFRSSTDTAERRKSRRHSTGTSPGNINKVLPTHMRLTPTQPALDEDSSSSTNSAEFSGGVFAEKKPRDGAGVTPGLRRRRERAERHRSFLKEQQEAAAAVAANGYMNSTDNREDMGQLVTAIPVTLKNGDSPPESLNIINENNCNYNNNNNHITNTNNHNNNNNLKHSYQNNNNTINHSNVNANLNVIVNATANANATNNNNALITNNHNNNNHIITNSNTATHNNNNNHINLLSPTKQLLGTNTISIINNSFDKSNTNKLQHHQHHLNHNVNAPAATSPAAEFYNKKNLFMERNATVINGLMKNIQRHNVTAETNNLEGVGAVNGTNLHANHCDNVVNYKKFENDANRLNTYYNQINNSTPKNQQHQQSIQSPNSTTTSPVKHNLSSLNSSPKKTINSTTTSTAMTNPPLASGFDYIPQTSTPHTTPVKYAATTTTMEDNTTTTTYGTPSTPRQRVMSPNVSSYPVQNAYNNTITTTTSVAPPPPPPPPPPPDLWGNANNMRMPPPPPPPPPPPYFYHQHSNNMSYNQNTTTNNIIPNSNQANNAVNTTNNNLNSNSDQPVDLLQINESDNEDKKLLLQLKRDHTVKDLTQKLCNLPTSPTTQDDKLQNRIVGDMSGLISKAKEGLAKSKSKGEMSRSSSVDQEIKKPEPKKSENDLQWEELVRNISRPLNLCDLDFTDLNSEDEKDILAPRGFGRGIPPPPPPIGGVALPPPMMPTHLVCPPPMNHPMSMSNTSNGSGALIPPPMFSYSGYGNTSLTNSFNSSMNGSINGDMSSMNTIKKNKKTVKLFWKEVREDLIPVSVGKTIWDELPAANVDTQKLEHLFESRAKDLMTKEKQQEMNKSKEVIVLDHKRSNAINIAMTKLPPPRAIKAAILKMDATVVTREGIDKLLNMLPTDEEKGKIQEAQMANPELPLGSAEQFLLTLASISELAARLRLWAFRLDFDNSEKEIAEPLMDLKQGIEILKNNRTFKCILSTLLSVGIFLNGAPVKGFQIEYLSKVPEVKDTVHKHSLLHHLCHMVMESGNETTDLYSEIGPITRASKADFNDLAHNLSQLEHECKASWDRLKLIAKHDCPPQLKQKLVDFLADCAERIIILQVVHRRIMNRYRKFLLWLGVPQHSVADSRPNEFCRIVSEFALEYRTTRERVQQQIEKKANHRERNKTRGKLIVDIAKFKTKEDKQDAELKFLLGTPNADTPDGTLTWRRRRAENLRSPVLRQSEENFTDGDDEILESLVKTATKAPGTRTTPRERKRTRHADRKSLRRTLKNGLTEEEKLQVAALIKTY
ncbi:uncharacterized protein LOC111681359 isoform X1 [Lucilia cuprina]|uniref:uncharacterized protein LOC111681359 isoform X1 n=1 Tax=Lucilia cuprina TaxID=7375 RepID=UPI001F059B26|nr:uncharacterized protein LOC111681359 isoform X1 [Lucilia cuprina]